MKERINSICLDYGDARFHLYQFHVSNKKVLDEPIFHEHCFYEIHIAHSGSHIYELCDRQIPLHQNQMLIIPPDVSHASVQQTDWNYEKSVISLSLTKIDGESGFYSFFQNALNSCALTPVGISTSLTHRATELLRSELYCIIKGECYLKMQASALIYELFDLLDQYKNAEELKGSLTADENRLILLDAIINDTERSLTDIAEAINYSPRHTARLIKSTYGCSLSELRKKRSGGEKK